MNAIAIIIIAVTKSSFTSNFAYALSSWFLNMTPKRYIIASIAADAASAIPAIPIQSGKPRSPIPAPIPLSVAESVGSAGSNALPLHITSVISTTISYHLVVLNSLLLNTHNPFQINFTNEVKLTSEPKNLAISFAAVSVTNMFMNGRIMLTITM